MFVFRYRLIPILAALLALLAVGVARGELRQLGNLRINFSGSFSPHSLPRDRPAPLTIHVGGAISTTDGTHPPALRKIEIELNRNGRISTEGLPACTSASLQSTTAEAAMARCGPALVGHGHFNADVDFPTPFPAAGSILAFNGRHGGHQALLLHLYGTAPVQTTFVLPLTITHRSKGQFGTILSAPIPTLAGGVGSVSEIDLTIGRSYTYRGQRRSFISASCAAPAGFTAAIFSLARGNFYFVGGKKIQTTLARDCRVR
jgi:hypothetical protein